MRWMILATVLALILGLSACRDQSHTPAPPAPPAQGPSQFLSVMDLPCARVQDQVRAKLKADPGLGLVSEKKVDRGLGFAMPQKLQGNRRWDGVVLAQCFGPQSTRLSVQISAERRVQGKWRPDPQTADLEKAVLQKLAPIR